MANSTDVYWDVDGTSLQTLAFNIVSWGGDRETPPPLRGTDDIIPYAPGRTYRPKVVDSRVMTLGMWVIGATEDGLVPAAATMRAEFEKNFKALRKLLWTPKRQFLLTKRFKLYGSPTVLTAVARGQYAGGLAPVMNGDKRASFTVDIMLADPYFYGNLETITFAATGTSTQNVTILGDDTTLDVEIDLNGARGTPKLTDVNTGVYVQLNQALGAGQLVRINNKAFTATKDPTGTPQNVVRDIVHAGNPFWFPLNNGAQSLQLTGVSGTAGATLRYRPVWL